MDVLRTPDDRFDALPGYPFAPHYVDVPRGDGSGATLRVHYLDEGPATATETVLLMHGEPSWSYLYRTMIPVITGAGYRAVAPDLVGFGRSDKPADRADYTYQRHVDWMRAVVDALDLTNVTLMCQDWGGLIGLRLVAEEGARFARVVAANTFLPDRRHPARRRDSSSGRASRRPCRTSRSARSSTSDQRPSSRTSRDRGVRRAVPGRLVQGRRTASSRCWCRHRPTIPRRAANRAAWTVLEQWKKPFLTAFSDQDPVTGGGDRAFQAKVPGTAEPAAHHDRRRWSLPPGGPRPGARRVIVNFMQATAETA